jgi:hypothetical protein
MIPKKFLLPLLVCSAWLGEQQIGTNAFTPSVVRVNRPDFHRLYSSTSEDVSSLRVGELKKELESYGISTKSFLEKSELVEALIKARADGLKPPKKKKSRSSTEPPSPSPSSSNNASSSASSSSSMPREERLKEEMEACQKMKAGELKKELEERGISTRSFFEKSEFVKALAVSRVDGVEKKPEESYAEYANVEVLTDDDAGPRKKQDGQAQGQAANPFGGAAGGNPVGGMGGMGGMADMLKNMGGMGGGNPGGNPAGGMGGMGGMADMLKNMGGMGGGNPGGMGGGMGGMGDMMGQAQEMMKNPKVMEIMMKAQSNPKIMKAMQECMSNPAAFAKYQNDPEVGELMNELKKIM